MRDGKSAAALTGVVRSPNKHADAGRVDVGDLGKSSSTRSVGCSSARSMALRSLSAFEMSISPVTATT